MATVLSWSGGKDSALALWAMREELGAEPVALMTTVTEDYGRVSTHGVRRELARGPGRGGGAAAGRGRDPGRAPRTRSTRSAWRPRSRPSRSPASGTVAFADLFLADIRAYREERAHRVGRETRLPDLGTRHRRPRPRASSTPASRRSWSASIRRSSTPPSPAAPSTRRCSPTCRRCRSLRRERRVPHLRPRRPDLRPPRSRSSAAKPSARDGFVFTDLTGPKQVIVS